METPLPKNISDFAAEERKFLHDLANPLAIATGMLEAYRNELDRTGIVQTEALTRKLDKAEAALTRLGLILTDHRPRLIAIQDSVAKP